MLGITILQWLHDCYHCCAIESASLFCLLLPLILDDCFTKRLIYLPIGCGHSHHHLPSLHHKSATIETVSPHDYCLVLLLQLLLLRIIFEKCSCLQLAVTIVVTTCGHCAATLLSRAIPLFWCFLPVELMFPSLFLSPWLIVLEKMFMLPLGCGHPLSHLLPLHWHSLALEFALPCFLIPATWCCCYCCHFHHCCQCCCLGWLFFKKCSCCWLAVEIVVPTCCHCAVTLLLLSLHCLLPVVIVVSFAIALVECFWKGSGCRLAVAIVGTVCNHGTVSLLPLSLFLCSLCLWCLLLLDIAIWHWHGHLTHACSHGCRFLYCSHQWMAWFNCSHDLHGIASWHHHNNMTSEARIS